MVYSIHTFELTLVLETERFNQMLKRAYSEAENSNRIFQDKTNKFKHVDLALWDKGIKIEYHDNTYKKRIKFIVNPSSLLGGDDIKKLWKPTEKNVSKLISKLEKYIENYFESKYKLDDFKLTRMDFTVNINVESKKNVSAYIKVLRNIGKVKGFKSKYTKKDSHIDKTLSFDLTGRSNDVDFTAYDKEGQSERKDARGILRIEVRLMKAKSICKNTNKTTSSDQIESLALNSRDIFLETFAKIVPCGDYYKKQEAEKIINDSGFKKKQKDKMLKLLKLIPKKKSIYLAKKEMNDRNIDNVFAMFEELNLSPVAISKGHKAKYLKNLYFYLLGE